VQNGEAGSAATDDLDNIAQMEAVRQLCKQYLLKNILNMDETGLNWKRTPDHTLATTSHSGTKKSKDRIAMPMALKSLPLGSLANRKIHDISAR
jgi:hypothetical protein